MCRPLLHGAETGISPRYILSNTTESFVYVTQMTDKRMRVSLRVAITMTSFSNVKPQYDGFIVKINGRDWTVNIMMFGETALALLAGNEPEE